MKKIIILILTIVIAILAILGYTFYNNNHIISEANKINSLYSKFYNTEVLGTDIASLINKTIDTNDKNQIEKDSNGRYIENSTNSIKIEIKFLESDDVIQMEAIGKKGIDQFVKNFGTYKFKCTKIDYHEKTGSAKYVYIEQI